MLRRAARTGARMRTTLRPRRRRSIVVRRIWTACFSAVPRSVLAYDFKTGKRIRETTIGDPKKGESAPAAPIAWNGLVFIGNAGGDLKGVKGRMQLAARGANNRRRDMDFLHFGPRYRIVVCAGR